MYMKYIETPPTEKNNTCRFKAENINNIVVIKPQENIRNMTSITNNINIDIMDTDYRMDIDPLSIGVNDNAPIVEQLCLLCLRIYQSKHLLTTPLKLRLLAKKQDSRSPLSSPK